MEHTGHQDQSKVGSIFVARGGLIEDFASAAAETPDSDGEIRSAVGFGNVSSMLD